MPKKLLVAFFLLLAAVSVEPIRSYDYFWHLATGRWIVEHRALPATDPFAVASERIPWINGEWLFDVLLYLRYRAIGHEGLSIMRGFFVASLFTFVLFIASKRSGSPAAALLLTVLAWAGADHRLGVRPEAAATLLFAIAIALLLTKRSAATIALYALLAAIWINVHPSALLAPVLAGLWGVVEVIQRRSGWLGHAVMVVASGVALLLNPHGAAAVVAPIRLALFARERGEFVNLEWLPSSPAVFPLLYVAIAIGVVLFAMNRRRSENLASFVLFLFLAFLAVRFLRNQGFFFAAFPILVAPFAPRWEARLDRWLYAAAAGLFLVGLIGARPFRVGIDERVFPVNAVRRLADSGLRGTILNPDQFGGLLIWTFYPERRAVTDGRNELYRDYIVEYGRARGDARLWTALLDKYDVAIAVDEYREPLDVIDGVTGASRKMPASLAYFPRDRWALIAFDERAMIFARRDRHSADAIARLELKDVPDAPR